MERPLVELPQKIDPHWLAGFTSAEGCFIVSVVKSQTHSVGWKVQLVFVITQHLRDQQLLICIIKYLGCGKIYRKGKTFDLKVYKLSDIVNKIIPFFKKYPILGVKALDFADFCKAAELMKNKAHLTKDGLEQIRKIKASMNRKRYI